MPGRLRTPSSTVGAPLGDVPGFRLVSHIQNHDQVGNRAFGERLVSLSDPDALRAATVVLLRDLGPLPGKKLYHTIWGEGGRVIDEATGERAPKMRIVRDGIWTPILASDLEIGDLVNCQPDALHNPERYELDPADVEGIELQVHKSKASLVLLRMDPADIKPGKAADGSSRKNWDVQGIVAYSKICTHVGCPISLNERTTHHLLCPCHQSTFDLADSGKVVFGPAGRPLPQLPLTVDEQGYLVARSDFDEPVGPSFWERDYYER